MEVDRASVGGSSIPMDLEVYCSRYTGHTKLARLNFVYDKCPSLQNKTLLLLGQTILNGINTEMFARYSDRLVSLVPSTWAPETDKSSEATAGRLGGEITSSRASLNKSQIRNAHLNFGEFLHMRGDLSGALKQYTLARDHSSNTTEMVESAIKVIVVAVDMNNYTVAENQLHKVEQAGCDSPVLLAQLMACKGLLCLKRGEFEFAARTFVQVSPYLGDSLTSLICAEDVGIYGTLCALAALDRDEVKSILVDGAFSFSNFVELDPLIGDLATSFVEGDYGKVMSWLSSNETRLLLDMHLAEHVQVLFKAIRERCILQYVSPYLSLSLVAMAKSFSTDLSSVESSVAALISSGRLNARIDSAAKTIHVVTSERRAETFSKVAKLSDTYLRDMQGLLLRMSCLEKDLIVTGPDYMDDALRQRSNHGRESDFLEE